MKKYIVILLLTISASAYSQISIGDYSVELNAKEMSVRESFALLKTAIPLSMWFYDQYVIKDGVTYYRPGFSFLRKNKAYIVMRGDLIKVQI